METVLYNLTLAPTAPTYIIQVVPIAAPAPDAMKKYVMPSEIWEIQQLSLFQFLNVSHVEQLPKIFLTIVHLSKDKAR